MASSARHVVKSAGYRRVFASNEGGQIIGQHSVQFFFLFSSPLRQLADRSWKD
jgi:hypothetical protein